MQVSQTIPTAASARAMSAPPAARGSEGRTDAVRAFDVMVAAYAEASGDDHPGGAPARTGAAAPTASDAGAQPAEDASPNDPTQNGPASAAVLPFVQPAEHAGWTTAFLAAAGDTPEPPEPGEHAESKPASRCADAGDVDRQDTAPPAQDAAPADDLLPWLIPAGSPAPQSAASTSQVDDAPPDSRGRESNGARPAAPAPGLMVAAAHAGEQALAHGRALANDPLPEHHAADDASQSNAPRPGAAVAIADSDLPTAHESVPDDNAGVSDAARLAQRAAAAARAARPAAAAATPGAEMSGRQAARSSGTDVMIGRGAGVAAPKAPGHTPPVTGALLAHDALPQTAGTMRAAEMAASSPVLAGEPLPERTITDLVQSIRLRTRQGGGEAHIQLEPHHFGDVRISIRVDDGQVVARVIAESPAVRDWLQTNQSWLRTQLAEQQLTLDRLEVQEPADAQEAGSRGDGDRHPNDQRRQRRARQEHAGARFDVVA